MSSNPNSGVSPARNGVSSAMNQSRPVYAASHTTSPALDTHVGHPLGPGSTRLHQLSSAPRAGSLIIRTIPGIDTLILLVPCSAKVLVGLRVSSR
ncbi:hypothetical protein CEP53_003019 [Fusarium sp. AF-6]|nr:hypothetical protein CEP53_003019 [Fusarium sp. AF-6]